MQVKLNKKQQEAVDYIYGPLLVLAGPGTGKTQLLSSRVATILQKTDVNAHNILCLTFTESGVHAMRERLRSLIGDAAYDVHVSTYHAFGSDIIKNYAEYFQSFALDRTEDIRMEQPIDELTQIQIIDDIVSKLPFDNPLLSARYYIKSVASTISSLKQHLFTPAKTHAFALSTLEAIENAQPIIDDVINSVGGFSSKKASKLEQYNRLLNAFKTSSTALIKKASQTLQLAFDASAESQSIKPLSKWKDTWLYKDESDAFTLTNPATAEKLLALSGVYEAYQTELKKRGAYDFDDMILRAIDGLSQNDELRFNIQERYQFILLDEFQDTNPSQFELVKRIADHPVHEGKPNIMAVGDDDQAIFAFQGADVGNMQLFKESFTDVKVINLTENYRSHPDILHVAHSVANQITDRLHFKLDAIEKTLVARAQDLPPKAAIERHAFSGMAEEYAWTAEKIDSLIAAGEKPDEIAVLAPRHAILEGIVPFLKKRNVPMYYEKRENILEAPIVVGLKLASELLIALSENDQKRSAELFPKVLSLPHWQLEPEELWQCNWAFDAERYSKTPRSWAAIALESSKLKEPVSFFLELALIADNIPLETTMDMLIGSVPLPSGVTSPLKEYYFTPKARQDNTSQYYETLSHLSVIRARLRDSQRTADTMLKLSNFLELFTAYEAAEASLLHSHPVASHPQAVQIMTVYKSKGLEFKHVFILQAHDDVWGGKSKANTNKLSLPPTLSHIRYVGASDDERKRLFFVALTRAKIGLYITSHDQKDSGKSNEPLQYLQEADGRAHSLPAPQSSITRIEMTAEAIREAVETVWSTPHTTITAHFRTLLSDRLAKYKMSPTHLNSFIDLEYAGPEVFLLQTLLRFPQAPTPDGEYGTAIHNALEWYQLQINNGIRPDITQLLKRYDLELSHRYLSENDALHASEKGRSHLAHYIRAREQMFASPAKAEVNFYSEGVSCGEAQLSGKIDRLEIDEKAKTVRIVDYKTGKPLKKWSNDTKSIKYKQQLYFYKFLIEGSATYRHYAVSDARLEFIEADNKGVISEPLYCEFNQQEESDMKQLISAVWQMIQTLHLPDVSQYPKSTKGSKDFISSLLK